MSGAIGNPSDRADHVGFVWILLLGCMGLLLLLEFTNRSDGVAPGRIVVVFLVRNITLGMRYVTSGAYPSPTPALWFRVSLVTVQDIAIIYDPMHIASLPDKLEI